MRFERLFLSVFLCLASILIAFSTGSIVYFWMKYPQPQIEGIAVSNLGIVCSQIAVSAFVVYLAYWERRRFWQRRFRRQASIRPS